jgi:hypothetical protein
MPSGARTPPGPLTQEITALLREHIARARLKYNAVAAAAHIPPSTFSDVIGGKKPLDIEQLDYIAWAVGVSLVDLVKTAEKNTDARQARKDWPATRLTSPTQEGS